MDKGESIMGNSTSATFTERLYDTFNYNEVSKKGIYKEYFTAAAENKAKADELIRLAEEAFSTKGKVYAVKEDKKCVCWAIIKFVEDRREGKKIKGHYETLLLEAAPGHENKLEQFTNDTKDIMRQVMGFSSKAEYTEIGGVKVFAGGMFGIEGFDSYGKKKIHTEGFTALAGSKEKADELVRLAEHALETKGKVCVLKNKQKQCICWCIIDLVEDGMEGKKKICHYETVLLEAVPGHEEKMDQFKEGVKGMMNENMAYLDTAKEFHIDDEIITPYKISENPNFAIAISMGLVFGLLFQSYLMGICFFMIYLSLETTYKVTSKKKKASELKKDEIEE